MKDNLYFFAKSSKLVYLVVEQADGSLFITLDGKASIPNAGMFINCLGGIDAVKARCIRDSRSLSEIRDDIKEQRRAAKEAWMQTKWQRKQDQAATARLALDALIANSEGGIIDPTVNNLRVVARYLAAHNWGAWELPKMSIDYKACQYDSGAVTMMFDQTVDIYGDMVHRVAFFAQPGELTHYKHVR